MCDSNDSLMNTCFSDAHNFHHAQQSERLSPNLKNARCKKKTEQVILNVKLIFAFADHCQN